MTPTAVITNNTRLSVPVTRSRSSCVSRCEEFARYSAMTGTKACENAPSAKNRLSRDDGNNHKYQDQCQPEHGRAVAGKGPGIKPYLTDRAVMALPPA